MGEAVSKIYGAGLRPLVTVTARCPGASPRADMRTRFQRSPCPSDCDSKGHRHTACQPVQRARSNEAWPSRRPKARIVLGSNMASARGRAFSAPHVRRTVIPRAAGPLHISPGRSPGNWSYGQMRAESPYHSQSFGPGLRVTRRSLRRPWAASSSIVQHTACSISGIHCSCVTTRNWRRC